VAKLGLFSGKPKVRDKHIRINGEKLELLKTV
jgi:hypothetical protein